MLLYCTDYFPNRYYGCYDVLCVDQDKLVDDEAWECSFLTLFIEVYGHTEAHGETNKVAGQVTYVYPVFILFANFYRTVCASVHHCNSESCL